MKTTTPRGKEKSAFWLRFLAILAERELTQRDVSKITGISPQAIQKWKDVDGYSPDAASMQLLVDALRVPMDMLKSDQPPSASLVTFLAGEPGVSLDERAFLWSQAKYLSEGDPGEDWWHEQLRSYRMRMRLMRAERPAFKAR